MDKTVRVKRKSRFKKLIKSNIPRALNLVKNVADLKQMSGRSKTAKYNGTVKSRFHTSSKVVGSVSKYSVNV